MKFSLIKSIKGHDEWINALYIDKDYLYSGSDDKSIKVWDKKTWNPVRVLNHEDEISQLSGDDKFIYSGTKEGKIYIWKKSTYEIEKIFELNGYPSCSFSMDKIYFIAGVDVPKETTWDRICKIWQKGNWIKPVFIINTKKSINTLVTDNSFLYIGTNDNFIQVFQKEKWELKKELHGHSDRIFNLAVDENYLFSTSSDGKIGVWNKQNLDIINKIGNSIGTTPRLAIDNNFIYAGSYDVEVWDKKKLNFVSNLEGHDDVIFDIKVDESYIYTVTRSNTIRIWKKNQ